MNDQKLLALKSHPIALLGKTFLKLLKTNTQMSAGDIQLQKIEDFFTTLPKQSMVIALKIDQKFIGLLYLDEALLYWIIDRMMGGAKAPYIKNFSDGFSKIDLANISVIAKSITQVLETYFQTSAISVHLCQLPFERLQMPQVTNLKMISIKITDTKYSGLLTLGFESSFI